MRQRFSRSWFLFLLAAGMTGWFIIGKLTGSKPDAAILGFAAAIWAAWDNEVLQQRRRRQRLRRRHEHKRDKDPPPPEPPEPPEDDSQDDYFSDYQDGEE